MKDMEIFLYLSSGSLFIHNSNESLNKCFITGDFNYDLSNQDNEHVCNFIEMILEGH